MPKCPSCNTECIKDAKFCHNCGMRLMADKSDNESKIINDQSNQKENSVSDSLQRLMPKAYLDKLLKSNGNIEGERRVVTILFSDIKGSTALAENLDPEDVLEIMNGAFDVLIAPINKYGGTLARLMGDAILAFFGAPIAHENDPYLAGRAALDIIEGVKNYSKKLERERGIKGFAARVGINTGLVVVAEVGADLRVEYTAMGDAVNIAARMESAAEPNTILITETTKKLIQNNFEFESKGLISVKGKLEPLNVYRLAGLKEKDKSAIKINQDRPKIIGRDKELSILKENLDLLQKGSGKIISVTGEQGLGKSRLIEELRILFDENLKWVEGRAYSYTQKNSYGIVKDLLNNLFETIFDSKEIDTGEKLRKMISNFNDEEINIIHPSLAHFLNIDLKNNSSNMIDWDDAETLKGQIHYAYKKLIENTAASHPIVLVFEDLHWADIASLELIEELFTLVENLPILLILIYRSKQGEIWKMHNNYLQASNDAYISLHLEGLDKTNSVVFLQHLLKKIKLTNKFQNKIFEKTEGNPFFIEELVRSFTDRKIIDPNNQKLNCDLLDQEFQIPNLLHSAILSRVDCLSHKDKFTLQIASVIGKKIRRPLLTEVICEELHVDKFDEEIEELQNKEFLISPLEIQKPATSSSNNEFIFKSSLIQEVVYDTLMLSQRKRIHKSVGQAIEKLFAQNKIDYASELAYHYSKGNVLDKAITYYSIAARKSKEIFANEDAIFLFKKALELSENSGINPSNILSIHESLGDIYTLTSDYQSAIDHFNQIQNSEIAPDEFVIINYKCGQVYERWGRYEEALNYYNESLKDLNLEKDSKFTALAYAGIGMVYYRQEKLEDAVKLNEKALEILEGSKNKLELSDIYNNLGIIFCKLENLEISLDFHKKCYNLKNEIGNISGLAASNNNLGYLYQEMGMIDKALEYYKESLRLCEKTGNLHGLARVYDNISHVYLKLGKNELAQEYNIKAIVNLGKVALKGNEVRHDIWLQSGVW